MIWVAAAAVLLIAGGTWFLAKTAAARLVVFAIGAVAIATYWFIGRPDMPDKPLAGRLAELEQQASASFETMEFDQLMALAQKRAQEDPTAPGPHMAMGELFKAVGRPSEAILAYQATLRRDPDFQPAIKALADLLFRMSGAVDTSTRDLYRRAFELDPSDLRLGYMAGLGDWQAGDRDRAEAIWADIEARTPEEDPRREMFRAIREAFTSETPETPADTQPPT